MQFHLSIIISISFVLPSPNFDEVSACTNIKYENGCCVGTLPLALPPTNMILPLLGGKCNVPHGGNCNLFRQNCAVCAYVFDPLNKCNLITKCSCYYCCLEEYKNDCPQGCAECIIDGTGGCPDNAEKQTFTGCGSFDSHLNGVIDGFETTFSKMQRTEEISMAFEMIDANMDGSISMDEAIQHIMASPEPGSISAEELAKNSSWFDAMDKNGNQKIEAAEFDRSLDGNAMNGN